MGAARGWLGERGVSEIYGTLLIISLAFAVSVLLIGFGFVFLDDSLDETEDRIAEDSVTEFDQRVAESLRGAGNQSVWRPPPGAEESFRANESQGTVTLAVETRGSYWNVTRETLGADGQLVDAFTRRSTATRRLGTLSYEADDGATIAYQGGAVFRKQDEAVTVRQQPPIEVQNGQLRLGLVEFESLPAISSDEEFQIRSRSLGGDGLQRLIERHMQQDGESVAEASVTLRITSEYADGWAAYAESIEGVDDGDIYRASDRPSLGDNEVLIDLGTFGEGLNVENRSSPPVIYSGRAQYAAELHNTSAGELAENRPGFEVREPDPEEYTVGVYRALNETDDQREWWVWNETSERWENVERSNEDVEPIDPLRDDRFEFGYDTYPLDDQTVTCVVDTSAPDDQFREFVETPGEGCLDGPTGVDSSARLAAEPRPYLEVSDIDVTGPNRLDPDTGTLDVEITVANTGPGNATDEDVALFLDDQSEDGAGRVLVNTTAANVTRGGSKTVIDTTVDPQFLYDAGDGEVPFRIGVVTDDTQRVTDETYRIGFDSDVSVAEFTLDEGTITAGEPITGEIKLETNATGEIDTSGLVIGGPNTVGFARSFTNETRVDFTLNTDPTAPDFDTVAVDIPGGGNATRSIDVIDPRADPDFRIKAVDYAPADRNISVGEALTVEAAIKNVGNTRDTQPIQLANTDAGILAADGAVTLDPGASTTVNLTWTPTARDANSYPESPTFVFSANNRSALRTVTVDRDPDDDASFEFTGLRVEREVVAGESLPVQATLENTGSEEATRTVWLETETNSAVVGRTERRLGPGETATVNFTWNTDRAAARPDQDRELLIRTRESTREADVTVYRRSEAADPAIVSLSPTNQTVTEGDTAQVTARVRNPDTRPAAGEVTLETDEGVPVDSVDVTPLDPGENRDVTLTWHTVIGDVGLRNVTASVSGGSLTAGVEVTQRFDPRDVAVVHQESRSVIAREDLTDLNTGPGLRLATDVEGIAPASYYVTPGEMTVPGHRTRSYLNLSERLFRGGDVVWRATAANGTTEYFYTGEDVPVDSYDTIEVLRPDPDPSAWRLSPGRTNVTAGTDELWFEALGCYPLGCILSDQVLPTESASTFGAGYVRFDLRTVATVDVDGQIPNLEAEFYSVDNETYRHLGALAADRGGVEAVSESQTRAWERASNFTEIVPPDQTWDDDQNLSKNGDLYRTGERPDNLDGVNIYSHGSDPFAERNALTRQLLGALDPTVDRAGYVRFDDYVQTHTALSGDLNELLTNDFDELNATVGEDRGGPSNLTLGIRRGVDMLTSDAARPTSDAILVLFSDGVHNTADPLPVEAATEAAAADVTIYTVGLGDRVGPGTTEGQRLREIANVTGGEFVPAADVADLVDRFSREGVESINLDRPSFDVEVTSDDLGRYQFGEEATVPVEVTNVGNATGEQPVWLTDMDGGVVDRERVRLAPGNSTTLSFSWTAEARDPAFDSGDPPTASGALTAYTGADADTTSVAVEDDPATFTVSDVTIETAQPVAPTEELTVETTVRNDGGASDLQQIWLKTRWGEPVDSATLAIDGGDASTTTLDWDLTGSPIAGDRTAVTVGSEDDTASKRVAVQRAAALPPFEVTNVTTNATLSEGESIEAGQRLGVVAQVTNTGSTEATQYLELSARSFDAGAADVRAVELDPGETKPVVFTWQTTVKDVDSGESVALGEVQVRPENGTTGVSDTVAIDSFEPNVTFDLSITDLNAAPPDSITAGEDTLVVNVTVANTGTEADDALVAIRDTDAPPRPTSALVLADLGNVPPSGTASGSLVYRTKGDDYTIDEIEASVARYRENVTRDVQIDAPPPDSDVTIDTVQPFAQSRPAAITAGDPLGVKVTLADPTGSLANETAVVSLYEGASAAPRQLLDTRAFDTTNGTLLWTTEPGDGDNTAPQQVTVAVRGTQETEEVYINEAPSTLIGAEEGEDQRSPIRVEVDAVEVSD